MNSSSIDSLNTNYDVTNLAGCTSVHRPGLAGVWSFLSYTKVAYSDKWAKSKSEVWCPPRLFTR